MGIQTHGKINCENLFSANCKTLHIMHTFIIDSNWEKSQVCSVQRYNIYKGYNHSPKGYSVQMSTKHYKMSKV